MRKWEKTNKKKYKLFISDVNRKMWFLFLSPSEILKKIKLVLVNLYVFLITRILKERNWWQSKWHLFFFFVFAGRKYQLTMKNTSCFIMHNVECHLVFQANLNTFDTKHEWLFVFKLQSLVLLWQTNGLFLNSISNNKCLIYVDKSCLRVINCNINRFRYKYTDYSFIKTIVFRSK